MARYRGGRLKVIRRLGTPLPGLTRKVPRREAAPQRGRPRKISDFGRQLIEKQKLRYHYGVSESQMRRYFRAAEARKGVTGEILLSLLERRLDNSVFRLGFAPTIPAARQLVSHGHVLVNDQRVTIPSFLIKPDDLIAIHPGSREIPIIQESIAARGARRLPSFLDLASDDPFTARVIGEPLREDVPFPVDEAAVVAYYSR